MAEESKYITKKKPEYITKKKPEYITKKKKEYITKKKPSVEMSEEDKFKANESLKKANEIFKGFRSGGRVCKLATKGKGKAYGKNS
tara:strand:+ start:371 stop:628 length:258 start_codon:yes stop_codon:yes gene_type:complete